MSTDVQTDDRLESIQATLTTLAERIDQPPQRWLSIESAAKYCDLSTNSIRNLLAAGKLVPHRPIKGRILLDKFQIDATIGSATARPRTGRGLSPGTKRARMERAGA